MKRSKLMAFLLAALMVLTMMPFTVSATEAAAQAALDTITVPSVICGTYNLTTEVEGYTVEWSSNPDGAVVGGSQIIPGGEDTEVTLYADIFFGEDEVVSKEFPVLIKRAGIVYYEGFDAAAGTNISGFNGWARHDSSKTGTTMTIEKESETSDNMVLKIAKTTGETNSTNYIIRNMNRDLSQKKDFTLSFRAKAEQDTAVIDLRGVGQWEQDDGTPRVETATYSPMFNLRLYYRSNLIELMQMVNPVTSQHQKTTMVASKCLKVGEWQTFEFQFDYSEQAYWLIIDGEKVTSQPIPYERRNIYQRVQDINQAEVPGDYGYTRYDKDCALHELWMTHTNTQHGAGQACDYLIDDMEMTVDANILSMDRAIDVEYVRNEYNNIVFKPTIADKLWRVIAGKDNAGKTAIIAAFNANDELVACPQVTVDENGYAVFNYALSGAKYIKAFIWDSMETLQPLSESFTETVR